MQVPLEIAFHHCESSPGVEQEIRDRVADLEQIYDRIISCRVRVDKRAKNDSDSVPPVVHVELHLPGHKTIMVAHEPDHLQRKFQNPDLSNAINEAFRIAERQLVEFKERRGDHPGVALHESENQLLGQVADIDPNGEFGFLLTNSGGMLYFHRNAVISGDFAKLRRGDDVHYIEGTGDTGPIASKVRVKEGIAA